MTKRLQPVVKGLIALNNIESLPCKEALQKLMKKDS
jgi:hypothetical protein